MQIRPESPIVHALELYCDEFAEGPAYTAWRPHGSGDWLLIYTEAGAGKLVTGAGTRHTEPGDVILYAPGDPQDYGTSPKEGRWRLLWVHFTPKPHWQIWLSWPATEVGLRFLHLEKGDLRESFRAALLRMIHVSRRKIPGALDLAANALEEALLWANVAASEDEWLTMDNRVRKAIDYMVAHLGEPFLMETLARHCGASVSRLAHLFKEQTGSSPQQFLERHRMQHASRLLRITNLGIAEIAVKTGYPDAFYFSNRFRRYAGKSPSAFRREFARKA